MGTVFFILGVVITVLLVFGVFMSAVFLTSQILDEEVADYSFIPTVLVCLCWLLVMIFEVTSLFSLFWWPILLFIVAFIGFHVKNKCDDVEEPTDTDPFYLLDERQIFLCWTVLTFAALRIFRSIVAPTLSLDLLNTVLPQARSLVQAGGRVEHCEGISILTSWSLIGVSEPVLTGFIGFAALFFFIIAAYGVPRASGAESESSMMTAMALACAPFMGTMLTANPQAILASTFFLAGVIILGRYPEGTVTTAGFAGAAFGLSALCLPEAAPSLLLALFLLATCCIPCRKKAIAFLLLGAVVFWPTFISSFNQASLLKGPTLSNKETVAWLFLWPYSDWSTHLNIGPGGLILLILGLMGLKKMAAERENHPRLFLLVGMALISLLHFFYPGSHLRTLPYIKRAAFWLAPGLCAIMVAGAKIEDERADYAREVALILNLVYFIPRGFGWLDLWPIVLLVSLPFLSLTILPAIIRKVGASYSDWWSDVTTFVLIVILIALLPALRASYRQEYVNSATSYERPLFDTIPLDRQSMGLLKGINQAKP